MERKLVMRAVSSGDRRAGVPCRATVEYSICPPKSSLSHCLFPVKSHGRIITDTRPGTFLI